MRGLTGLMGYITGHDREDVADPYLMRVSQRAWDDVGVDPPADDISEVVDRHPILKKFYEVYSAADAVDRGTPISQLEDPKVFRIKRNQWRGAVRYFPEDGTQWLCRNVSLAKYHKEDDAYNRLGELERNDRLLPEPDERRAARGDQFLVAMIVALKQARVRADHDPQEWHAAQATRLGGVQQVGRVWVEYDESDYEATFTTRYMLLVREPPEDLQLRPDWLAFVAAHIFPTDDPVQPAYEGLPGGTRRHANELPLKQETMEMRDEDEVAGL